KGPHGVIQRDPAVLHAPSRETGFHRGPLASHPLPFPVALSPPRHDARDFPLPPAPVTRQRPLFHPYREKIMFDRQDF
ncbi:MAG: hypothetical protein LBF09_01275, partial [Odoribacteraceae bacterium]|nr:hypothetical protein [Odoribacteraceae bacterium]